MKNKHFGYIFLFVIALAGCAKRGSITGGDKDVAAPKIISSYPKNLSTDFNEKTIKITFDEYIKIKDLQKNLIVSPLLKHSLTVLPQGGVSKHMIIKIADTLKPNTTYSFNFGESIIDNNEGNVLKNFKYVFSTGKELDSLTVEGSIKDAFEKKTPPFVNVMLYEVDENYKDSIIYKESPRYITNTSDSLTTFKLENIKAGKYKLVALKETSSNYKFDSKKDKIGFYNQTITVPDKSIFELELFKEEVGFTAKKPAQASGNRIIVGYEGNPKDAAVKTTYKGNPLLNRVTKFPEKDSLQVWVNPLKNDSISLTVNHPKFNKDFTVQFKNQKNDTLKLSSKDNVLALNGNLKVISATPLEKFDGSKMSLTKKDSSKVNFKTTYDGFNQTMDVLFKKEENEKYTFNLLPDAVEDYLGQKNDSIKFTFSTKAMTDYGNLKLVLKNVKSYPVIVDLTDDKGKVLYTRFVSKEPEVEFFLIEPQKYSVRIIYDANNNQQWDTGSFLENRQPEEVYHYPTEIDVRANWDVNQDVDLGK
ncbi:Ig-like domain-containing protein [Flavobacterium sp. H122]|uniref:Ig-like domain-containing protein n=1 Tax=Flavobacterium sp. H122 TaxID=2529860 RepID=UPI0010AA1214|nr:Ig-like domain-containing protein [Flavobacterium sp. H122]